MLVSTLLTIALVVVQEMSARLGVYTVKGLAALIREEFSLRMATFAITYGARPGNKKRDAVLRSVIRRAVRFGYQYFDLRKPFLCGLVPVVVYGQLSAGTGGKWKQLVPADGSPPPDVRGKRIKVVIEGKCHGHFGVGPQQVETSFDVPK